VQVLLSQARLDDLLDAATFYRMQRAGNIGGELLNWIAMLGMIGARKPRAMLPHAGHGHAFGVWRWN
jgi:gallate dioxygenase